MKEFKSFYTKLSEECVSRYKDVSKAIFVTGCPGSGKDVVIREIISKTHITELNHNQIYRFLADKDNLSKKSTDMRLESVRKHNSIIINAPADDIDKILYVKEELEEMNYEVDPQVWFAQRELEYPPAHFITASTPATIESKQWVLDQLRGRFSITQNTSDFLLSITSLGTISFEDPSEATVYELKWS